MDESRENSSPEELRYQAPKKVAPIRTAIWDGLFFAASVLAIPIAAYFALAGNIHSNRSSWVTSPEDGDLSQDLAVKFYFLAVAFLAFAIWGIGRFVRRSNKRRRDSAIG